MTTLITTITLRLIITTLKSLPIVKLITPKALISINTISISITTRPITKLSTAKTTSSTKTLNQLSKTITYPNLKMSLK